ncbi:enoyl-CoA hydratase/isomerase family protein [Frondihabitans australicus]|uniref:Enoyl-CoA hydratase/carnithine racemase n=1 Tax=Frondihabitans australicus TaxID=386892 RepID=A0A495IFD5_9MICO|nr:enoyl-CoA hydratase/isomerase family protein [Frondihabitans australicus]RKR74370.1 enoyl-CoA hydratase/carnithine racemase [Frondihabitans australicus]
MTTSRPQEQGPVTRLGDLTLERLSGDADGITILTIDRPDRMNAVTSRLFADLGEAARTVRRDGTRALIITGAGDRAFSAGYDLAEIPGLLDTTVQEFLDIEDVASGAVSALHSLPFPVIAAVNGAAAGGGLSLALAADLRIVASHASFSAAFVRVGFSVGELGTSWMLSRVVGPGLAAELAYTGRPVSAAEASEIGLADRVVEGGTLREEAIALARAVSDPATDRIGKRALVAASETASLDVSLRARLAERP